MSDDLTDDLFGKDVKVLHDRYDNQTKLAGEIDSRIRDFCKRFPDTDKEAILEALEIVAGYVDAEMKPGETKKNLSLDDLPDKPF